MTGDCAVEPDESAQSIFFSMGFRRMVVYDELPLVIMVLLVSMVRPVLFELLLLPIPYVCVYVYVYVGVCTCVCMYRLHDIESIVELSTSSLPPITYHHPLRPLLIACEHH